MRRGSVKGHPDPNQRAYWAELKETLRKRHRREPTPEGHRVTDENYRNDVPVSQTVRELAHDPRLSRTLSSW